jgi:hypothetical protein
MKKRLATCLLALVASSMTAFSQAPEAGGTAPRVKVDIKKVQLVEQGTPDFAAGNVTMKRWRPKKWIEVDVEFDIKVPQEDGGRNGSYSGLQFNLYLVFQAKTKDGKHEAAKATLTLENASASETCHLLAYIAPSDIRAILQKDNFTMSDVMGYGVEVQAEGKTIAGDGQPKPSAGNIWWQKTDNFAFREGIIKAKSETPFATLFGDYDVPAKGK